MYKWEMHFNIHNIDIMCNDQCHEVNLIFITPQNYASIWIAQPVVIIVSLEPFNAALGNLQLNKFLSHAGKENQLIGASTACAIIIGILV